MINRVLGGGLGRLHQLVVEAFGSGEPEVGWSSSLARYTKRTVHVLMSLGAHSYGQTSPEFPVVSVGMSCCKGMAFSIWGDGSE